MTCSFLAPSSQTEESRNPAAEAKIAWALYRLFDHLIDQLWNRYEKQFVRLAHEKEEERIAGEWLSQMDPDSPSPVEF